MADIDFECLSSAAVPDPHQFHRWATAALQGRHAELGIRVVDEDEGRRLNLRYRGRDKPTNVLSFPADLPPGVDLPLLGDLVICAPVVIREAGEQNKDVTAHWAHLTVHGVLHLLGYDHETSVEAGLMEEQERRVLAGLGFSDPYD